MLSAKWATFDRYGSPMPDWDQWDAEALETYVPWFARENFLSHLFTPHNEHRVVLTKLQNLALVLLNGQWDARLQAVVNAALHAVVATAFWLLGLRVLSTVQPTSPRHPRLAARFVLPPLLFLLALALFGLPVAWQNVLGGFHSQQYWLAGLSFAAIVTLPFARAFSASWWLGAGSALLVLGSMGSGFLAAVAVTIVLLFRLARRETTLRAAAPSLVICALAIAVGVLTRNEVPWHAQMKAKTVHDFAFSIIHSLQWPWRDQDLLALVLWSPWLLLALQVFTLPQSPTSSPSSPSPTSPPQAVLALGGWVLLQLAATAYARGAGADYPASRYMDTLTFGAMANALALACLLHAPPSAFPLPTFAFRLPPFAFRLSIAALWFVALTLGLWKFLADTVRWELDGAKSYYGKAESNLRRYLTTNDPKHFANPDIPCPGAEGLVERLAIPSLRALMPVPIRAPLPLQSAAPAPAFLENNAIGAPIDRPPRRGLSPATPPLDYTSTWGSFAPPSTASANSPATPSDAATWRSTTLSAPLGGWLKFETAGQHPPADRAGAPDAPISLALHDAATGAKLADVAPNKTPGDQWRSAYVRAPAQPFVIVARDASPTGWLAFSGPVEMAWLSVLAWQACKHAALLFTITAAVTIVLAGLALLPARRSASA